MNIKGNAFLLVAAIGLMSCMCLMILVCSGRAPGLPGTAIIPVADSYHGIEVVDDYRWLENDKLQDVSQWDEAQTAYT